MTPISHLRITLNYLVLMVNKSNRRRVVAAVGVGLSISLAAAAGVWTGWQTSVPASMPLASIAPQGALLSVESKDFSGLLKQWDQSSEKTAWLKSEDYAGFSRSRLFGRLRDAQKEFARAAGLPPDMSLLHEVAGSDSIFAWYDVGKLEFLYVTRMAPGEAEKSRLFALRGKFTRRQIGGTPFYVRTVGEGDTGGPPVQGASDSAEANAAPSDGPPRTVAFAVSGDWLLLATREDLMAGALTLLDRASARQAAGSAKPATAAANDTLSPLSAEAWFQDARAVAAKEPGELRMTLNLEKIVRTPYFRSYWVQRNVSEIKQYRSAVTDLYLKAGSGGSGVFREERVLLPKTAPVGESATPDMTELTGLLPEHTGVYRASALPGVDATIHALDEKLLAHAAVQFTDLRLAPQADVEVHPAGGFADLETRLDATPLVHPQATSELNPLREALAGVDLKAMMTVSRTGGQVGEPGGGPAGQGVIWVPFQSAVVLSSGKDWDAAAIEVALQRALAARITTSNLGLAWKPVKLASGTYLEISAARPLEMAIRGHILLLCDDPDLMVAMMDRWASSSGDHKHGSKLNAESDAPHSSASPYAGKALLIAGFDTAEERGTFERWTALVDRNQGSSEGAPGFFSGNMRSLSEAFSDLAGERMVESRDGDLTRQTVTYAWRH